MGAVGGALGALADKITQRAEQQRLRQNQLDDEQRQSQNAMIDEAIKSGNLSPGQIQVALDQKKKLYPKEVHPLIDKFGEVLGHVFRVKQAGTTATGAPSTPATTPASATLPEMTPVEGAAMAPVASATPSSSPNPPAGGGQPTLASNVSPMASVIATANPGPVAKAKTTAQATLAGNEVIQGDRIKKAQNLIADMKAAGILTPQVEQAIRMEAQGFSVPPSLMRPPMTGKQLKPIVKDGVYMGMENPLTNETYASAKDAPPEYQDEAMKLEASVTQGLKDKEKRDEEKQQRTFDHQMTVQEQAFKNAIGLGDYRAAKKAVHEAQGTLNDAIDRQKTMDQNLVDLATSTKAGHPNQQAALSLVANHIGMTLGLQKGARITKSVWDEAQMSAPWLSRIGAKWSSDGYLTGLNITVEQAKQMVGLAHEKVSQVRDRVDRVRQEYADDLPQATEAVPPKMKKGAGKAAPSSLDDEIMKAVKKAKSGG